MSTRYGKTSALAITSLVLGVSSFVTSIFCCGPVFAIPAVICGHIAAWNISRSHRRLSGDGMAMAGYILGYVSIAITIVMYVVAAPKIEESVRLTAELSNAKKVHADIDALTKQYDNPPGGFPADIGITSVAALKEQLLKKGVADTNTVAQLDKYLVGNVSEKDSPKTILLKSHPTKDGGYVIFFKDGSGQIVQPWRPMTPEAQDPPREPAYLSP